MSDGEDDLFRRQFGGEVGAGDARTVEAGAIEPGLGNVDAAFERGRWIVAVGTHTGCRSAKLPNQANVPEPLGYPPSQKARGVNPWMNASRRVARPISLAESF